MRFTLKEWASISIRKHDYTYLDQQKYKNADGNLLIPAEITKFVDKYWADAHDLCHLDNSIDIDHCYCQYLACKHNIRNYHCIPMSNPSVAQYILDNCELDAMFNRIVDALAYSSVNIRNVDSLILLHDYYIKKYHTGKPHAYINLGGVMRSGSFRLLKYLYENHKSGNVNLYRMWEIHPFYYMYGKNPIMHKYMNHIMMIIMYKDCSIPYCQFCQ